MSSRSFIYCDIFLLPYLEEYDSDSLTEQGRGVKGVNDVRLSADYEQELCCGQKNCLYARMTNGRENVN